MFDYLISIESAELTIFKNCVECIDKKNGEFNYLNVLCTVMM